MSGISQSASEASSGVRARARRPDPKEIAAAAKALFAQEVRQISAPGGQDRASVRVTLTDQTVIATIRADARAAETERSLLQGLSRAGAPVPRYLGRHGPVLFQEDVGRARLSSQLNGLPHARVKTIAAAAFNSLWQLKDAANRAGLTEQMPVVAMSNDWLTPFCYMASGLSRGLDLPRPELDVEKLANGLVGPPKQFVKWDTRPGNAMVQPDGRVIWFDWEHAGRRHGAEDFAFLAGDEFWTLGAEDTLALFAGSSDLATPEAQNFLICFTTLQIVQRIEMIFGRVGRSGWTGADRAMRYDKIGAAPKLLQRLAAHGADWAQRDPRVAPLANWFPQVAEAIVARHPA